MKKEMIPYKIALVTPSYRLDVSPAFTNYQRAKEHFCHLCALYDSLPIDALCILEQNALVVEAYRFVSVCNIRRIDGKTSLASRILARRKSLAGMPCHPMSDPEQLLRRLDMGDTTTSLEDRNAKKRDKKYGEDQRRSTALAERIQSSIFKAFTFRSPTISHKDFKGLGRLQR